MNILNKKTGFTLTEMLIVIIIIAILSAGGIPFYRDYIERQKTASGITTMRAIADSLERYMVLHSNNNRNLTLLDMDIDRTRLSSENTEFNDGNFTYSIDYIGNEFNDSRGRAVIRGKRNTGEYELVFNIADATLSCTSGSDNDICDKLGLQDPPEVEEDEEEDEGGEVTPDPTSSGRD